MREFRHAFTISRQSGVRKCSVSQPLANDALGFGYFVAPPDDRAVGIEQDERRIGRDLKLRLDGASAVLVGEQDAIIQTCDAALRLPHAAGALGGPDFFAGDADDFESAIAILLMQSSDFRQRSQAGRAPGAP